MVSEADKVLAHNIRDLVTKLNRRLRKQISNLDHMSITELNVFRLLIRSEKLLPSEFCAQLNISSQYMSQVLKRLESLAYISRKHSLEDKRKSFVILTKKGKKKIADSRQEREEWLAESIARSYSAADKQNIQKAVKLLVVLADL